MGQNGNGNGLGEWRDGHRPFYIVHISKKFKQNIVVCCWQSFSSLLSFFRTCMDNKFILSVDFFCSSNKTFGTHCSLRKKIPNPDESTTIFKFFLNSSESGKKRQHAIHQIKVNEMKFTNLDRFFLTLSN